MTAPSSRAERIAGLSRIGFAANRVSQDLGSAAAVPMPLDLAGRVRALAEAARDVAAMAEREIAFLEAARDWTTDGGAP